MNKFLILTAEQRRAVFERVGVNVGLPMQAVEKDFWVTLVLQTIFSLPVAEHLIFKGGTSLSKACGSRGPIEDMESVLSKDNIIY